MSVVDDDSQDDGSISDDLDPFKFTFKNRRKETAKRAIQDSDDEEDEDDDDDDDDEEEDEEVLVVKPRAKRGRKPRHSARNHRISTDKKLNALSQRLKSKPNAMERVKRILESDDELDVEKVSKKENKKNQVVCLDSSSDEEPFKPVATRSSARAIGTAIGLGATALPHHKSVAPTQGAVSTSLKAIEQARLASAALRMAQNYHAEDVPVVMSQPPIEIDSDSPPEATNKPASTSLGLSLRLSLRTTEVINGKRVTCPENDTLTIRMLEPMQRLLEKFRNAKELKSNAKITFTIDGEAIDFTKTPASYDLESDDLIDVIVQKEVKVKAGPPLRLVMRTIKGKSSTNDTMSIKKTDLFKKLLDQYKKKKRIAKSKRVVFLLDGEAMDLSKTPAAYDLKDKDIIDVKVGR